jgi:hypothetical protein
MISQVIDIVDTMPETGLYEHFKNQLLEVHELSDYEKFNVLVKMEPMGRRKPSQLLHPMPEFCPVDGYGETSLLPLPLLVDKCSAESFATVSALTAAASADSGPPPTAQLTVPQSPVHSHWSSVTSPQSPVRSHRSPEVYNIPRCRRRRQPSQPAVLKRCLQNFLRWSTPPRRYPAAPLAMLSTTLSPRDRRCPVAFVAWTARN